MSFSVYEFALILRRKVTYWLFQTLSINRIIIKMWTLITKEELKRKNKLLFKIKKKTKQNFCWLVDLLWKDLGILIQTSLIYSRNKKLHSSPKAFVHRNETPRGTEVVITKNCMIILSIFIKNYFEIYTPK